MDDGDALRCPRKAPVFSAGGNANVEQLELVVRQKASAISMLSGELSSLKSEMQSMRGEMQALSTGQQISELTELLRAVRATVDAVALT